MAVKKNLFTYISYIIFFICTLFIVTAFIASVKSIDYLYLSCGIGFLILLPIFLFVLSVIFHGKNNFDKLDMHNRKRSVISAINEVLFLFVAIIFNFDYLIRHSSNNILSDFDKLGFVMAALLFVFVYLTARAVSGRLAAIFSLLLCIFLPDYSYYIFCDRFTLFSTVCIWFVILWFSLFFNVYKKKEGKLKFGYFIIFLCGLTSNLLVITSTYGICFILIIIFYLLFKHWKPAFLYIFAVFPALFFAGYDLIHFPFRDLFVDIFANNFSVDFICFKSLYVYSEYLYMIMFVLAYASIIALFKQNRKTIQILMCFVSVCVIGTFLSISNANIMLYIITVYTIVAAHFVQSMYSFFVKIRCKKYYKKPETDRKTTYEQADTRVNVPSEESVELPIPVAFYDNENPVTCTIVTKESYQIISKDTLDAFERRKQRAMKKAAEKYKL